MKNRTLYISLLILFLNYSCKTDSNKIEELDVQKSTELIIQILNDESDGYLSSSCILENIKINIILLDEDIDEYLRKQLNILDTVHYNKQIELHNDFKITTDLAPSKNIITQKQIEKFLNKAENDKSQFRNWLDVNCENEYCFISKPIFNETFDLAYVEIGGNCGRLCGGGEQRIYEFSNGKWIKKKSLGIWVS